MRTVDQGAPPEKKAAHELTPVSCGFGNECVTEVVFPMAFIGVVLAVVGAIAWNVGRRLIRRRRRKPSGIG